MCGSYSGPLPSEAYPDVKRCPVFDFETGDLFADLELISKALFVFVFSCLSAADLCTLVVSVNDTKITLIAT